MKKKLALIAALLCTVFVFAQNTEELQNDETANIVEDVGTLETDFWSEHPQISISYAPYIMIEPSYDGFATMFSNGFLINSILPFKKGVNQVKWGFVGNVGFHFPSSITIDSNGESSKISVSGEDWCLLNINCGIALAYDSSFMMEVGIDLLSLLIPNIRTTSDLGFYTRYVVDINMSKNVALSLALKASMSVKWMLDDDKLPEYGIIPSAGIKFKF